jgi:hypothetical protein
VRKKLKQKRQFFDVKLNSIQDTDNPTKKECEFILHDFEVNHNGSFISKETALKSLHTLKDMPIVCKYYPVSEAGAKDDALGSHEVVLGEDRETGKPIIEFQTVPIGVFTEPAYIKTIVVDGKEKEVVAGKGVLWASRFPNVVGLLKEWVDNGIEVVSSMEILYDSYIFKDGVEEILSYVYEGHCILNSEDRGNHAKVYPAYDVSKLTRLVAQAIQKEGEKMEKFKKVYELSHSDIRSLLYGQLDPTLPEGTYSWIADVYDSYFIVELYTESESKFYKFNYTKTDDAVTIDFESKTKVTLKRDWVEVTQVQQMEQQLNEANQKIDELQKQLTEAQSKIETLSNEKESLEKQFNEASEKLIQLNSQIEELKPFKEKYEQEQYEKKLSEKQEYYAAKFEAVNAKEKFETEEVQELIKKSVFENEEGKNAILQLNSMLVDLVQVVKDDKETTAIKEFASKRENLIPAGDDFESRYSI